MMPQPECPRGHLLSRWRNRSATLICDGVCGQGPIGRGAWRWSCTVCDYDICEVCADGDSKSLVKQASSDNCMLLNIDQTHHDTLGSPSSNEKGDQLVPEGPLSSGSNEQEAITNLDIDMLPPDKHVAYTPAGPLTSKCVTLSPVVETSHELGWLYMVPGSLDSVRKGLEFRSSGGKGHKQSSLRRAYCPTDGTAFIDAFGLRDGLCLPVHEPDDYYGPLPDITLIPHQPPPALLPPQSVPDLTQFAMPTLELERMLARREHLQHVFELEVARQTRAAMGVPSAFEVACGLHSSPNHPFDLKELAFKFQQAREEILYLEQMEVEAICAAPGWL